MTILTIKDLTIQHQGNTIVNNVNLTIHEGEWLALVGESGSGKSVTASAIGSQCRSDSSSLYDGIRL